MRGSTRSTTPQSPHGSDRTINRRAAISAARGRVAGALALLLAGMLLARSTVALPSAVLFALAGIAATASLAPLARRILLGSAMLLVGAATWNLRIREVPSGSLATSLHDGEIITVEGRILDRPEVSNTSRGELSLWIPYTPAARFRLEVHRLRTEQGWVEASGILRARISGVDGLDRGSIGSARAGDQITLTGRGSPVLAPLNPGEPDARAWSAQEEIAGSISAIHPDLIALQPEAHLPGLVRRTLLRWRANLAHAAAVSLSPARPATVMPEDPASIARQESLALVRSLILGLDDQREDQVQQRFTRLGIVHILAISGYHIVVLSCMVAGMVRICGDHGRAESLAVTLAILAYAAIVPASAPVLRAVVCILAIMFTRALGRRYDPVCVLLWAAAGLAIFKPVDAFSLGYFLSFGLCTLLMLLGDPVHARLTRPRLRGLLRPPPTPWRRARSAAARFTTATFLCWASSAPMLAWWTGICSPITLAASALIVPVSSLLLAAGFVALLAGLIAQGLAPMLPDSAPHALYPLLDLLARLTLQLVDLFDRFPLGSLRAPPMSLPWSLAATLLVLFWFARGHSRHTAAWTASIVLLAWLSIHAARSWDSQGMAPGAIMHADVLAVGEGSCTILRIRGPGGVESIMVDAGSSRSGLGLRVIPDAARALGCWRIPTAIILGENPRCFSALPDAARALGLQRALIPAALLDQARADPHCPQAGLVRSLEVRRVQLIPIHPGDLLPLADGSHMRFEPGLRDLRAIVSADDPSAPDRLLITHDPPAIAHRFDAVVASGPAVSDHAVEQLASQTHAGLYIISTGHDADPSSDRSILRTAAGHVQVTWSADGSCRADTRPSRPSTTGFTGPEPPPAAISAAGNPTPSRPAGPGPSRAPPRR